MFRRIVEASTWGQGGQKKGYHKYLVSYYRGKKETKEAVKKESKKQIQKVFHMNRQENMSSGMLVTADGRENKNKNGIRIF